MEFHHPTRFERCLSQHNCSSVGTGQQKDKVLIRYLSQQMPIDRLLARRQAGHVSVRQYDGAALGRGGRRGATDAQGPLRLGQASRHLAGRQAGRV